MRLKIYYLGPEGTHSHEAAESVAALFLSPDASVVACSTLPDVLDACFEADSSEAFACVPIENSIQGSVWQVWDGLTRHVQACESDAARFEILAALTQPIHQYAVYSDGTSFDEVAEVLSHPQALAQCAQTIKALFPNAIPVSVSSTADAVRRVAQGSAANVVAIGSRRAAERHGLQSYPEPIEDRVGNVTRFALIGRSGASVKCPAGVAQTDLTVSLCLRGVPHRPGGLVEALQMFANASLNLTRLESRPVGDELGKYVYFVDVSVRGLQAMGQTEIEKVREELSRNGTDAVHLGAYPVFRGN